MRKVEILSILGSGCIWADIYHRGTDSSIVLIAGAVLIFIYTLISIRDTKHKGD